MLVAISLSDDDPELLEVENLPQESNVARPGEVVLRREPSGRSEREKCPGRQVLDAITEQREVCWLDGVSSGDYEVLETELVDHTKSSLPPHERTRGRKRGHQ